MQFCKVELPAVSRQSRRQRGELIILVNNVLSPIADELILDVFVFDAEQYNI